MTKWCNSCKKMLDIEKFSISTERGYQTFCKKCRVLRSKTRQSTCLKCGVNFRSTPGQRGLFCSKSCASSAQLVRRWNKKETDEKVRFVGRITRAFLRLHPFLRPNSCPNCNKNKGTVTHHKDYAFWNRVCFLCDSCHKRHHLVGDVQLFEVDLLQFYNVDRHVPYIMATVKGQEIKV